MVLSEAVSGFGLWELPAAPVRAALRRGSGGGPVDGLCAAAARGGRPCAPFPYLAVLAYCRTLASTHQTPAGCERPPRTSPDVYNAHSTWFLEVVAV